jgi:hypothetical protein
MGFGFYFIVCSFGVADQYGSAVVLWAVYKDNA